MISWLLRQVEKNPDGFVAGILTWMAVIGLALVAPFILTFQSAKRFFKL